MGRSRAVSVLALLWVVCSACSAKQLGLPRVALAVEAPGGEVTALVRNHPEIDPPNQSLWLRRADGTEVRQTVERIDTTIELGR